MIIVYVLPLVCTTYRFALAYIFVMFFDLFILNAYFLCLFTKKNRYKKKWYCTMCSIQIVNKKNKCSQTSTKSEVTYNILIMSWFNEAGYRYTENSQV